MAKKRTRKDKEQARHNFTLSWNPKKSSLTNNTPGTNVKSQLQNAGFDNLLNIKPDKLATFTEENTSLASIKKDVIKSLILAAFILASEIMIYLNWTKILSFRFGFQIPNLP